MTEITIRPEKAADAATIEAVVQAAFAGAAHSDGNEAGIVRTLRAAEALTLSLVALRDGEICGHVAFSPVQIDGRDFGWFGLGPVAVRPQRQRQGIGRALIGSGLEQLRGLGAAGCVVLGDPGYYRRCGFAAADGLMFPGVPAEYFQALSFAGAPPRGTVSYHAAFDAASGS